MNLNLLNCRVPAYQLPRRPVPGCPVQLLTFGKPKQIPASQPIETNPVDLRRRLNTKTKSHACQANIQSEVISAFTKQIGIGIQDQHFMKFLQVTDIDPGSLPKVSLIDSKMILPQTIQKFDQIKEIPSQSSNLTKPPLSVKDLYIQRDLQESRRLIEQQEYRVAKLREDPLYEVKQTYSYKVNEMQNQLQQLESIANSLQKEMLNGNQKVDDIQQQYQIQQEEARKKLALEMIEKMEKQSESGLEDEFSSVLKLNQELFRDIEDILQPEQVEVERVEEEKQRPPRTKRFYNKSITPAVLPRPENYKAKTRKKAVITHRLTKAMNTAQEAIYLSNKF